MKTLYACNNKQGIDMTKVNPALNLDNVDVKLNILLFWHHVSKANGLIQMNVNIFQLPTVLISATGLV